MTMQRFDPFRDFWRHGRPIGPQWRGSASHARAESENTWAIPVDVVQDDDNFTVRASLPGFKAEDIDVSVDDGVLTISGANEAHAEKDGDGYLLREQRSGKFRRVLRLPETMDADKAESIYVDGIVTVTLPKIESKKARRLVVKAG